MGRLPLVKCGAGHMISEKSQLTQNGTMFVDLDWQLNASRRLSASAEPLVYIATMKVRSVHHSFNTRCQMVTPLLNCTCTMTKVWHRPLRK